MSQFLQFKQLIQAQYNKMTEYELFETKTTKDEVWDAYLGSFKPENNPILRERTEHDCQCCKQFLRATANVVALIDDKLVSIWDIEIDNHYQEVANALSNLVKSRPIRNVFRHYESNLGTDFNHEVDSEGKVKQWNHFYYKLPDKYVMPKLDIATKLSDLRSNKDVLKSGFKDITLDAIETVLELIEQNSLYRGQEKKLAVASFLACKLVYEMMDLEHKDNYCWNASISLGTLSKLKNTSMGTLLIDISKGTDLNIAVLKYRKKVDPENYQRSSAVSTKGMIDKAEKKVIELGLLDSLPRRYAVVDDITIENVIFANREAKKVMNVFDELGKDVKVNTKLFDKVEEITIDSFISDILPKVHSIELMFENKHENSLMSLISPQNKEAKPLFKWDNNYCWNYNGDVADSMKERVKKAGGNIDGVLRFSIQWNDGDNNPNDFDAHCIEPDSNVIYYSNKGRRHSSSGMLDVDITRPGTRVAVENIVYTEIRKMKNGDHLFLVHNFAYNGGRTGFTAEIEFDGKIYHYVYDKNLVQGEKIQVATVNLNDLKFTIKHHLESSKSIQSKEIWGVNTNQFHKVSMIMNSPNYWDGNSVGNKHWFFMLEDCKKPGMARGFFNEYLRPELREDRKVFEVLGSKLRVQPSDNQLSGLGFSSTLRNSVLCKVEGSFSRTLRINF